MVWTGRQALGSIDGTIKKLRDHFERTDGQIQSASRELVKLGQQEGERYKNLARIRLDQLISGEIAAGLDAADRQVTELLAERDQALAALGQQIEEARQEDSALEKERDQRSDRVAEAAALLDTAEAAVQEQLEQDSVYKAQFEKASRADSVARHSEEKTAQAEGDRATKGKPYDDDPLFSYLWARGYGTSRYSANPLTRFLDKWVAGLCSYDDARPNYAMLLEIPTRLREHGERLRTAANHEFEALKLLEEQAAEKAGIPAKRHAVDAAERRIDEIDEQMQEVEARIRDLMHERAGFATGEDDYFRRCIETLASAFRRENLSALHHYVRNTSTAKDDVIVYELSDIDQSRSQLESTIAQQRSMYERQLVRLKELEEVRNRFKRERYDNIHSVFGDTGLLTGLLSRFLDGTATGADLWNALQREHRYRRIRANPTFGTGGFGHGGVVWRLPSSRGGGSWKLPIPRGGGWRRGPGRGGFGSGGGFRTGGGF